MLWEGYRGLPCTKGVLPDCSIWDGETGMPACNELRNHLQVQVFYGMDKEFITKKMEGVEDLMDVDAVIVTPIFSFGAIKKNLENKFNCPVLSLEDIVYRL